jgi:ABC-type siderophore export system fused ATPase/permease subunit
MEKDVFKNHKSRIPTATTTTTTKLSIKHTLFTVFKKIIFICTLYIIISVLQFYTIFSTNNTYRSKTTSGPELRSMYNPLLKTHKTNEINNNDHSNNFTQIYITSAKVAAAIKTGSTQKVHDPQHHRTDIHEFNNDHHHNPDAIQTRPTVYEQKSLQSSGT